MSKLINSKHRILLFSPLFAPFANPEAIVNNKLALAFLQHGWEVDVVTRELLNTRGYSYGSSWTEPWMPLKDITHEVTYEAESIIRKVYETGRAALRLNHFILGCRWAEHAFNLAMKLHKIKPYDVILSRSLPDSGHLPALQMAKETRLPWIANWNDATDAKNPPPAGSGVDASLGYFLERFLDEVARTADWHTFPSDKMRSHICSYLKNGTEQKSTTIPHIALAQNISLQGHSGEAFTLCYAGNLYAGRNPDIFLEGFRAFIDSNDSSENCKLIFIGLEDIGLTQLIQRYGLEGNVIVTGPLSYLDTLRQFSTCDVLIVLEAAYTDGIYLPSKFVDYVQAGKPILAVSPANGTLKDILNVHGGGMAADCTSVNEIKRSLCELYSCWKEGDLDIKYGSERLYKLYDPMTIVASYQDIFGKICNEK